MTQITHYRPHYRMAEYTPQQHSLLSQCLEALPIKHISGTGQNIMSVLPAWFGGGLCYFLHTGLEDRTTHFGPILQALLSSNSRPASSRSCFCLFVCLFYLNEVKKLF